MTASLRIQEAIETVGRVLGLSPAEAALYVRLCLTGPAKAGDLASALKLHRNEVYRSASRLVARRLVEMTLERPGRYAAIAPQEVFDAEIMDRLAAVEELRTARDRVAPVLEHMDVEASPFPKSTYKVVQGRTEIYALRDRLIANAESSVDWATSFPPSITLTEASGGLDGMKRRVDEGVVLRAMLCPTEKTIGRLERFRGLPGAEIRMAPTDQTIRFLIIDRSDLLMWVVNDPSESLHARDEVAIHTAAQGFIEAESLFFEEMWSRAASVFGP